MAWLEALWQQVKGLWTPAPTSEVSAADAIRDLKMQKRAQRTGTARADWDPLVRKFKGLVLGEGDRVRVWNRHRRTWEGTVREWQAIDHPTTEEIAALSELVDTLSRGR